ncbi:DUF1435 domain-containing protein [Siccibacter colletis]|uniref:DUF1435 domain-containing protein n=1 Tax=Siccibacter colletis TaxID=1505757 RepID=UPI0028BF2104|nr:DUF1435 domain-containing protein [Siccibacter colletis]WNN48021.1 DUF1435 domain-containing protein [Siccibacter colletis]
MILVIIIVVRGRAMLQRTLESGWGVLLPASLVAALALGDLTFAQWRVVVVLGLLATAGMLYHKRLRHYVLLPSCIAFASAMMLAIMKIAP